MRKELGKKHLLGIYTDKDYMELRDDLDTQIAKLYAISDAKRVGTVSIHTLMKAISEYFSSLDQAWDKASLEQKHAISSSMFPHGVICTRDALRTIDLEPVYAKTFEICAQNNMSTPVGTLLERFYFVKNEYIDIPVKPIPSKRKFIFISKSENSAQGISFAGSSLYTGFNPIRIILNILSEL